VVSSEGISSGAQTAAATRFVIAGAQGFGELVALVSESVEVRGAVPDLPIKIAKSQLYVAPSVSGGNFKNKVFEAIAAGTYLELMCLVQNSPPSSSPRIFENA
jgi:glycosyltransferase involved in cell wall biosynthesis